MKTFLSGLPEQIAQRLAQAVEVDRLIDGKTLPHEMILESLRPALRRAHGSDRTPTPLRAFCIPFEDLFTLLPRKAKQKGRIARGSVAPIWSWISQTLLPDETRTYAAKFRALIIANKHAEARAHAAAFWPVAAAAIQHALSTEQGVKMARAALGGQLVVEDAAEMAVLLQVGDETGEIQRILPKPVATLTDELLWALRAVYDSLVQKSPDAVPYVAVIAMHRLAKPWEALKLPLMVSRQTQDTLISSTDMGLVGEIIFGDIETYGKFVREARQPAFDPAALIENLSAFTTRSSGIVKGIDMRRDGKWGQRLLKDRAQLADVMDSFMERAPKEAAAALPMQKSGTFTGGPKVPDFSRPVDPEKTERGLRYVQLTAGCRALATAASFGAAQKKAEDDICQMLRSYNEDVVKELRTAEGPRRTVVESQFEVVCRMTAILFSDEEAEFLRRRGRAAQQAAAAA
ncbi:MAG: hypothetical protein ISS15_02875 [Alphaproteobacteria bacterium]|nr:hypothetical protein [Alphaproteobacteria bacterium]MBL7096577.1 hypothetical protein [Alphaproteobacteria bacterium]